MESYKTHTLKGQKVILTGEARGRGSRREWQAITHELKYIWIPLENLQTFIVQTELILTKNEKKDA